MTLIKLRPYGTKASSHLVNTDHIITVSAASNEGDYTALSPVRLIILLTNATAPDLYVPIDQHGNEDYGVADPAGALSAFHAAVRAAK